MASRIRFALAIGFLALLVPLVTAADRQAAEWTPEMAMQVKQVGSVQVSPDGKRVAFTVRRAVMDGDRSEYLTHIHVANADGTEAAQLTQGDRSCDHPRWSPDGKTIAFLSARSGKKIVWLIPARGGEARKLTTSKTDVSSLKWAPDGTRIAFTAPGPPTMAEDRAAKAKHGERDLRVPLSQGQELYNALKRQGCTTQMVVYPRTPHGIEEPKLLVDCMNRNVQWFDRYVRGK